MPHMHRLFNNNCYPPSVSARILVYYGMFSNVSLQTTWPLRFKLLEKSRQRKPEVALLFAFDRCELVPKVRHTGLSELLE